MERESVFVSLYNYILELALKEFLERLGLKVVPDIRESSVAVIDKVKTTQYPLTDLHRTGVNFLLVDTGLDQTELYFLVKNYPLSGVICPDMNPELLKKCIRSVSAGDKWFKRDFLISAGKESISSLNLTDREIQVIGYLIEGMTNKEIARELGVTEQTVKYYINQLLKKTGCTNRVKLVCLFSKLYPYIKRK